MLFECLFMWLIIFTLWTDFFCPCHRLSSNLGVYQLLGYTPEEKKDKIFILLWFVNFPTPSGTVKPELNLT